MKNSLFVLLLLAVGVSSCKKTTDGAVTPAQPVVTAFSPAQGSAGAEVTITGQHFGPDAASSKVSFNGTAANIKTASATQVVAVVPDGATTGPLTVVANGLTVSTTNSFTVIEPKITGLNPAQGPVGTLVFVQGEGFGSVMADVSVTVNGKAATITEVIPQVVSILIPARAGTGNIVVSVKGKKTTSPSAFTYKYAIDVNNTLYQSTDIFQSLAVDPDDGTVYASTPNNSGVVIIRPNGVRQSTVLLDNTGTKYTGLAGIAITKTSVGGTFDKLLLVTDELKGAFFYPTAAITPTTTSIPANRLQANDAAVYSALTSIVGVPQFTVTAYPTNGTYYMLSRGNNTVISSTRQDGAIGLPTVVGSGVGFNQGAVPNVATKFSNPLGIFLKNGLVYVADGKNNAIRVVDFKGGTTTTLIGDGTRGNVDGPFASARLSYPSNVAVDADGLVYITDQGNGSLRLYDPVSKTLQTVLTGLSAPYGLTIDKTGTLYLGEWSNGTNRILKLTVK
jgi:hypothetical protein